MNAVSEPSVEPVAESSAAAGSIADSVASAAAESIIPPIETYLGYFKVALIAGCIAVGAIAYFFGPLVAAKIMVSTIFLTLALTCVVVFFARKWILINLIELEEMGYLIQEQTMLNSIQAREGLRMLRMKIEASAQPAADIAMIPELMRHAGPLFNMLMKKEKSRLNWALFGFKVAKSAFDAYKQRK